MGEPVWEPEEGPRDRLLLRGSDSLADAELLAVLLQTGYRSCNAVVLARELLRQFGGLQGLMRADADSLLACQGVGRAKYALLQAAVELARRLALRELENGDVLSSPQRTRRFLQHHLGGQVREVFSVIFLDNQQGSFAVTICSWEPWMGQRFIPGRWPCVPCSTGRRQSYLPTTTPREWPSPAQRTGVSPSAWCRPWGCWTYGCWTTSSLAQAGSILLPRTAFYDLAGRGLFLAMACLFWYKVALRAAGVPFGACKSLLNLSIPAIWERQDHGKSMSGHRQASGHR